MEIGFFNIRIIKTGKYEISIFINNNRRTDEFILTFNTDSKVISIKHHIDDPDNGMNHHYIYCTNNDKWISYLLEKYKINHLFPLLKVFYFNEGISNDEEIN